MVKDVPVSVDLPDDLLLALGRLARDHGTMPSDELRAILRAALFPPPTVVQRLAFICRDATGWVELQHLLRAEGFVLRLFGGQELQLCTWPAIRPLMPAAEAGFEQLELTLRYGRMFPSSVHMQTQGFALQASVRLVA
ncbi:MAG: hypothetical protein WAT77_11105 [Paracoccaceae bacterium]